MNRIEDAVFCILDLETASMSNTRPTRICEIGAIKTAGGGEVGRFQSLVNPEEPISPDVRNIHGISDEMVREAPKFADIAAAFRDFSRGTVLVAHNTAFDMAVLNQELRRVGLSKWQGASIDTIRLARKAFSGLPSYGLDGLSSFFELKFSERHRSIGDCEMTLQVFWRCVARLKEIEKVRTLTDLLEAGRNLRAERIA